ncbi:MAG: translocation/assembly module TamB domain-containing protein, partial [Armatimonadetes bacterium]|nr:translocation/assembly module TamB domain-containing protein [Armatimonadota bacterium]
ATVEPIELGTRITVQGQIEPPLGYQNSQANLTIAQLGHENERETHGRLVATNIRIAYLPKRLQSFVGEGVKLFGGKVSTLILNWHQSKEIAMISGAVDLNGVSVALNFQKPVKLKPADAFLAFAFNMTNGKIASWNLTIRTTKPHRDLGQGVLNFEGSEKFLRVRWRGENFSVAILNFFAPTDLPIRGGNLSGSALFELDGNRNLIDADLTINSSHFRPIAQLQKLSLPAFKILRAETQVRLERIKGRWQGNVNVTAKSEIGQGKAKVWLNGRQGRADAEVANLMLKPFNAAILSFLPSQISKSVKLSDGFVSGNFSVSWSGQKFRVERVSGRLHQIAFESEWMPPSQLSAQVQMEGGNLRLSSLNVAFDKNAVAVLRGQANVSKEPIWQVQGQVPSGAIERLMAWAKAKWNLPFHLLRGGQAQIASFGFANQWQAQVLWDEPLGIFNFQGLRWQGQLSRMSLLAAKQGVTALVNKFAVKPSQSRIAFGKSEWQLLESIRFSEWRVVWDEKTKSLFAYGSVKIPQVEFEGLLAREGKADLEIAVVFDDKPKVEVRAINLAANFPEGSLVDGHVRFVNDEAKLVGSLKLRGFEISQVASALKRRNEIESEFAGQFNGELIVNAQVQSKFQIALSGEISDFKLADKEKSFRADNLTLTALGISGEGKGENWRLAQVAGDWLGRNIVLSLNGKSLSAEIAQVQGLARQMDDGWHWDLRLHKVKTLSGNLSGQGKGNSSYAEAQISFAQIDVEHLSRLLGLESKSDLPKGKSSGWLKFNAEKQTANRKDNFVWRGDFEGAALLSDAKWQDWVAKMVGVRARGQIVTDEKMNLKRTEGKFDGVHLLSEDGQAVLDGNFAFGEGKGFVSLDGRWAGVSLKKLSQRFELPMKLSGLAEGTVQILWDGKLKVSGTVKSQAVAVGESSIWRNVFGEWVWDGKAVNLKQGSAVWNGGKLAIEGTIATKPDYSTFLTIRSEDLALFDLSLLLREFQVPMSDWGFQGRADGKVWLSQTKDLLRLRANLSGQRVRLGLAELGKVSADILLERNLQGKENDWSAKGIVNLQQNEAVATAQIEGSKGKWQIDWRFGNVSVDNLKAIVAEWRNRQGEKMEGLDRWLKLPLKGDVSSEGYAVIAENEVKEMKARVFVPNLRGVGDFVAQAELNVERKGNAWTIDLADIRQGNAFAKGSVKIDDEGKLTGELAMNQVSADLASSILALLGFEVQSLPDGILSAKFKLAGTTEDPQVEGSLQAREVYWRKWFARQILVRKFEIRNGELKVEKGEGVIMWRTEKSLASFWGQMELGGERKINWQIELPPTTLDAILPSDLPMQIQKGWLSGSMALQGSVFQPSLKGSLELSADFVDFVPENSLPKSLEPLTKLRNIRCQVEADGKVAKLKRLVANWSGGSVEGSGWFQLGERGLQNLFANKGELNLQIQGAQTNLIGTNLNLRNAEIKLGLSEQGLNLVIAKLQGNGFDAKGDVSWRKIASNGWNWLTEGIWNLVLRFGDFRWQVKGAKGELSGFLALRSEKANEPPTLSGTLILHDGDATRLPLVASEGEGKWQMPSALKLALKLEFGDKFFLRNPQASLLLDGEFLLSGDLSKPRFEGELRSQRGTLRLPAAVLTITEMSLRATYAVDPLTSQWIGTARMRVEGETQIDIHRVLFTVSGPVDAQSQRLGILPSTTVMSIPPLPEQRALERMFGLGLAQLGEALTNWQQLFSGTLVQSFMGNLLAPVTEPLAQALRWTELSVIREQTTGRQWLRLGIPLSPRLHVLWRQGFSPADPSALEVQYYLGKRTSVTVIKQERERAEVRVQTSVRF